MENKFLLLSFLLIGLFTISFISASQTDDNISIANEIFYTNVNGTATGNQNISFEQIVDTHQIRINVSPQPEFIQNSLYLAIFSRSRTVQSLNTSDLSSQWVTDDGFGKDEKGKAVYVDEDYVYAGSNYNGEILRYLHDGTYVDKIHTASAEITDIEGTKNYLYVVDMGSNKNIKKLNKDGSVVWDTTIGGIQDIAIDDNEEYVYVIQQSGADVYKLDASDGSQIWSEDWGISQYADGKNLDFKNGVGYVGSYDKIIKFYSNSTEIWRSSEVGYIAHDIHIVNDSYVLVGHSSGEIYRINTSDGSIVWGIDEGNDFEQNVYSIDNDDEYCYAGNGNGKIIKFDFSGNVEKIQSAGSDDEVMYVYTYPKSYQKEQINYEDINLQVNGNSYLLEYNKTNSLPVHDFIDSLNFTTTTGFEYKYDMNVTYIKDRQKDQIPYNTN